MMSLLSKSPELLKLRPQVEAFQSVEMAPQEGRVATLAAPEAAGAETCGGRYNVEGGVTGDGFGVLHISQIIYHSSLITHLTEIIRQRHAPILPSAPIVVGKAGPVKFPGQFCSTAVVTFVRNLAARILKCPNPSMPNVHIYVQNLEVRVTLIPFTHTHTYTQV